MAYLRHGLFSGDAIFWVLLAFAIALIGAQFFFLSYVLWSG
jgi:hypothetical protein